jgi:hypothetical protein
MSLSDYIRYLRAAKGGLTPWEIAELSGVPARDVHLIEVKHRRMGDDETLAKLAVFFEVPVEELTGRREAYRKRLTEFLDEVEHNATPIMLKLESSEELTGAVAWYSREAVALRATDGDEESDLCVVQRGWVADWRAADSDAWEVASSTA